MKHPIEVLESDWLSLDEGDTLRTYCESDICKGKTGKALTITKIVGGCLYNCYRCGLEGYPGIISQGSNPATAIKRIKELRHERKHSSYSNPDYRVSLPRDFINLIDHTKAPAAAYAWLYMCELDIDDIYKYNIGYSNKLDRVIIPVYDDKDLLIGWQGRDIYYKRNKELYNKGLIKRSPLKYYTEYNKNKNNKLYYKINKLNKIFNNLIIVEDMLSTIKVYNNYKFDTVGLMNSTINQGTITDLNMCTYDKVYLWLDWDKRIYSIKKATAIRNQGIDCTSIRTVKDPKHVPYKEMNIG